MYTWVLRLQILAGLATFVQVANIDNFFVLPMKDNRQILPDFSKTILYYKKSSEEAAKLKLNPFKDSVTSLAINKSNKLAESKNSEFLFKINKHPHVVKSENNPSGNIFLEKLNAVAYESITTNYTQINKVQHYLYNHILNPLFHKNANHHPKLNNNKLEKDTLKHSSSAIATISKSELKSTAIVSVNTNLAETKNDELDLIVLEEIKQLLLSLLKVDRPPKIDRSKVFIPEFMTKLYHDKENLNWNYVARCFSHKESPIDDQFLHHNKFRLYFDIHSIPIEEYMTRAELQLTRDLISATKLHPKLAYSTCYQVLIYDIATGLVEGSSVEYVPLVNMTVWLNSTGVMRLNVIKAVERWRISPSKNFGLLVEVKTPNTYQLPSHHHLRLKRRADEEEIQWRRKQPYLVTYSNDSRSRKRTVRDLSEHSKRVAHSRRSHRRRNGDNLCQRHPLYVDFSDVGWRDWIVAPPGYDAFFCQGRCPFPLAEHLNSTNHAVIQTIVNNVNPNKVPQACCVPTQLQGHSFLYLNDESTVVLKSYPEMSVLGCGCL